MKIVGIALILVMVRSVGAFPVNADLDCTTFANKAKAVFETDPTCTDADVKLLEDRCLRYLGTLALSIDGSLRTARNEASLGDDDYARADKLAGVAQSEERYDPAGAKFDYQAAVTGARGAVGAYGRCLGAALQGEGNFDVYGSDYDKYFRSDRTCRKGKAPAGLKDSIAALTMFKKDCPLRQQKAEDLQSEAQRSADSVRPIESDPRDEH